MPESKSGKNVSDLASAHVLALVDLLVGGASAALYLGTGEGASVREVVRAVEAVAGRPGIAGGCNGRGGAGGCHARPRRGVRSDGAEDDRRGARLGGGRAAVGVVFVGPSAALSGREAARAPEPGFGQVFFVGAWLRQQSANGRPLILATASDHRVDLSASSAIITVMERRFDSTLQGEM